MSKIRGEQSPLESESNHQSLSVIKVETCIFHKEEITVDTADDVANIISKLTLLGVGEETGKSITL
jgi:hypothetical protein